jgi:hypothetical protein
MIALQDDYRAWLDSLPESLQGSATAAASCELDLLETKAWSRRAGLVGID